VSTAYAGLWGSAVIAVMVSVVMAWYVPALFPGMPEAMHRDARLALILIGASLAVSLPASVAAGVFSGFQRNEVPALVNVASRVAIAGALISLAATSGNLVAMAGAYAGINLVAAAVQLWLLRRAHPELAYRRAAVTKAAGRELASYCFSLTIWSLGMLAISGLDAVIAGHLDFHWAGYFAVAASVVAVIVGIETAVLQPLVAVAAHLHSRREARRLGDLLIDATRANSVLCAVSISPIYLVGGPLLNLWVGAAFGQQVLPILQVLLIGVFARQSLAPFATILLGTGEQRLVIMTVFYEGLTKLLVSIALGVWLGPIGVALGTVAGGLVCFATNMALNFPRIRGFSAQAKPFVVRGILQPGLILVPVVMIAVGDIVMPQPVAFSLRIAAFLLAGAGAAIVAGPALGRLKRLV
jgi:O-antigen/teichoic acid export membrane protein